MKIEPLRDPWKMSAQRGSAPTPARESDLVITREGVNSMPRYIVQRRTGPPQLRFDSRQAALDAVAGFAERRAVDVRYRSGRTCAVLARHRRESALSVAWLRDG
ncbi:MAG: hypothetical protein HY701_04550 [Gemmatimonadetes bacterium]|nr:hypothetical protein [Gemmatimonadota bacterium]